MEVKDVLCLLLLTFQIVPVISWRPTKCSYGSPVADIVFLVDGTGEMDEMSSIMNDLIINMKKTELNQNKTRFAGLCYCKKPLVCFDWDRFKSRDDFEGIKKQTSACCHSCRSEILGPTYDIHLAAALKIARTQLLTSHRPRASRLIVLFMHTKFGPFSLTINETRILRSQGVRFIAVGLGQEVDDAILQAVTDDSLYILRSNETNLVASLWTKLRRLLCSGVTRRVKRGITCPSDKYLTAAPKTRCAVATWETPPGSTNGPSGGAIGECFQEGDRRIRYETTETSGWWWGKSTEHPSCTFTIHVKVDRCPQLNRFSNGKRDCDGVEPNISGSVCNHTCNIGYELHGNPSVRCSGTSWNSPFPTCQRICSWPSDHCWPGDCNPGNLAASCTCRPGFTRVNVNNGLRCQLVTPPHLLLCKMGVVDKQGVTVNSTYTSNITTCDNQRDEWINSRPAKLYFAITAMLNVNLSRPWPHYVTEFRAGVVGAGVRIIKAFLNGSETTLFTKFLNTTPECRANVSTWKPVVGVALLDCEATINIPDVDLLDGERFCVEVEAFSGGYYTVADDERVRQNQVTYQRPSKTKKVCFLYDQTKPVHCSDTRGGCNSEPLHLSSRLTRTPDIRVSVNGWLDPAPQSRADGSANLSVSHIDHYRLEVHAVKVNITTLTVQDEATPNLTKEWEADLKSPGGPYEVEVSLPGDRPQLYAIILDVQDGAGNVAYARRLVMFDNSSSVRLLDSAAMRIVSTDPRSNYKWQTDVSRNICVDWKNRFYNSALRNNNWLLPVQQDTSRDIKGVYDQVSGTLPVSGTVNINGVVRFEVAWTVDGGSRSAPVKVTDFFSESTCLNPLLSDGQTYVIWIQAVDVMNNSKEDRVQISIDHTGPTVSIVGLEGRPGQSITSYVHSSTDLSSMRLRVHAADSHSGLSKLEWRLGTRDLADDLGTGAIGVLRLGNGMDCTTTNASCYCPAVGGCEVNDYIINFNSLTKTSTNEGLHHREYYVTVVATNNAGLHSVKKTDILIDASPPTVGVVWEGLGETQELELDFTSSDTLHVRWRGFQDPESGVSFYRVALSRRCLSLEEMEATDSVTDVRNGNMATFKLPKEGHYYVSVVAYNGAMSPSSAGCSDGITYDTTPPHLLNVTVAGARVGRAITCTQPTQPWLINSNLTRIRLSPTAACTRACNSSSVQITHLPVKSEQTLEKDVSDAICRQLPEMTEDDYVMLPSDNLRVQWSGEDEESEMEEYWVGLGRDRSTASAPDLQPLTPTHGRQVFHLTHTGLGHGDIFYLFLRALSKAGLDRQVTIGPLVIDVTPPEVTQPLTAFVENDHLVAAWTRGVFTDPEQPKGTNFSYTFRVGYDGGFVTPFLALPQWNYCTTENATGCIRYPVSELYNHDTHRGLHFFFQLHVTNAAGHMTTVNTSSVRLPDHLPPTGGVVLDVTRCSLGAATSTSESTPTSASTLRSGSSTAPISGKTLSTMLMTEGDDRDEHDDSCYLPEDVDVVVQRSLVCAAWEGFDSEDKLSFKVGIGTRPDTDNIVSFARVTIQDVFCLNTNSLPVYTKLFSVVMATNTGGTSVFSSDGFIVVPAHDQNDHLMVFSGKGCGRSDVVESLVLAPTVNSTVVTLGEREAIMLGDILFVQFEPFLEDVVFRGAVLLQTTLTGYQLAAQSSILTAALPRAVSSNTTVKVMSCVKDTPVLPATNSDVMVAWEMTCEWRTLAKRLQVDLVDESCMARAVKKEKIVRALCRVTTLDVRATESYVTFHGLHLVPGHLYSASVRPCFDLTCLPAVSSQSFSAVETLPLFIDNITIEIETSDAEMEITFNAHIESTIDLRASGHTCVFTWSVARDPRGLILIAGPQVQTTLSCSDIRVNSRLHYTGTERSTLFVCVQLTFPWRSDTPVCQKVPRPATLRADGQFHVIELPQDELAKANIDDLLHSQELGHKLDDLYDLDMDFSRSDVTISAFLTNSLNRNVTWFLMTKNHAPPAGNCASDQNCVTSGRSNDGKILFPREGAGLQDGRLYYVCALVSSREISHDRHRVETEVCGDGVVIDDSPPTRGSVTVANVESGFLADNGRLLVTWSGFSDVEKEIMSLPDDATMNFSVALGSYPGGEDIAPFVQTGLRIARKFEDLNIPSGTNCIATVKAEDRVGHVTEAWSDVLVIDNSPPAEGHVVVGLVTHNEVIAATNIPVHWEGIEDKESGIKMLEVVVSTKDTYDEVIPFQRCQGNSVVLTNTSALTGGHAYIILVKSTNGAGLFTLTSSKAFVVDSSPPGPGMVWSSARSSSEHRSYSQDIGQYPVYWSGFHDPESGLAFFRVGLGSEPFETDVESFVYVGLRTSYTWLREFQQGKPYYATVQACNGANLCRVASSTSLTFDVSPPTVGHATVGFGSRHSKFFGHNTTLVAQWSGISDPQTGIQEMAWCAGTIPGTCDVVPLTPTMLARGVLMSDLALPVATPLYVTVRAYNPAGLHSVTVSNSFVVDVTPPEVVTAPYFLSLRNGSRAERQWDRSVLHIAWQFRDPDSTVVSHVVSVLSQQRGRLMTEPVSLGADTKLSLTLGKDNLLVDGDLYWTTVTACNAAGLCTTSTSSRLFVDSTPPFLGTFRSPLTWKLENVTGGGMAAVVNVTWQDFTDPESAVVAYYVIAGRTCNGEDFSNGRMTVVHDNGTYIQHLSLVMSSSLLPDVIFLGIWAENHVGLQSEMVQTAFKVVSGPGPLRLLALRYSCPVSSCTQDCACASTGQVCARALETCRQIDPSDPLLANFRVIPHIGRGTGPQAYSTSVKCLEGHWSLSGTDLLSNVSRFEWSLSGTNESGGERLTSWQDVGLTMEMTYCLPGERVLTSGLSYVLHVRTWLSSDSCVTFLSVPVSVDSTPPLLSRGKTVIESNSTCEQDVDYLSSVSNITACWNGVFTDRDSAIVAYEIWIGTSPFADDYVKPTSVGLSTTYTVSSDRMEKGTRYYVTVRAVNGAGLVRSVVSDGVLLDVVPPIAGVVFTGLRHTSHLAQSSTTSLSASWHGFQDTHSAVKSYHLALYNADDASKPLVSFRDVGFTKEYQFQGLTLQHNRRYKVVVKARDVAGLDSQPVWSPAILVDTTAPEGVTCTHFDVLQETVLSYSQTASVLNGVYKEDFSVQSPTNTLIKVDVVALNTGPRVRGFVDAAAFKMPLTFNFAAPANATAEYVFMQTAGASQVVTVQIYATSGAKIQVRLSGCSRQTVTVSGAVILSQLTQSSVSVCTLVQDPQSRIRSLMVGVGTTPGGLQVQPLTPVGQSGHFLFDVHVQHGAPLYASVMAENGAGQRVRFTSSAIYMDRTQPVVSNVKTTLTYEGEGSGLKVWAEAEWTAQDKESGILLCTCELMGATPGVTPGATPGAIPGVTSAQVTTDVTPGTCRWLLQQPRHLASLEVKVTCLNKIQMSSTVTSDPVLVLLKAPDMTTVRIRALNNNPFVSPFDECDPEVRSRNSDLEFTWLGGEDPSADLYHYRFLHDSRPLTEWLSQSVSKTSAILRIDENIAPGDVIVAEIRASNSRNMSSETVSTTIRLDDRKPVLTGKNASLDWAANELFLDWRDVFNVTRDVTYLVFAGTANGYGDVVNHVTLTATSYRQTLTRRIHDLFICIQAVYPNGRSEKYLAELTV